MSRVPYSPRRHDNLIVDHVGETFKSCVRSYILQLRVDGTFNGQGSAVGVVLELFRGG